MSWKQTASWQEKVFKKDAVRVAAALNAAKIACTLEYPIKREGEYNRDGKQKFYSVDILLKDDRFERVGIEMEGQGSASADDLKRDELIQSQGIILLHFPNKTKAQPIIDLLNSNFRKVSDL